MHKRHSILKVYLKKSHCFRSSRHIVRRLERGKHREPCLFLHSYPPVRGRFPEKTGFVVEDGIVLYGLVLFRVTVCFDPIDRPDDVLPGDVLPGDVSREW